MSQTIQILNPTPGGSTFTNSNRARRFVRDGRAEWADATCTVIRFISTHHACKSAVLRTLAGDPTGLGYDRINRPLTRDELKHIPFAGNIDRLMGRGMQRQTKAAKVA